MTQEPVWNPKLSWGLAVRATCVSRLEVAPVGCCGFVGGVVDVTCEGRRCLDGTFCPKSVFSDAKVFVLCPVRLAKLKLLQAKS